MIRRPPRSTLDRSSAASDVYKRQELRKFFTFGERFFYDFALFDKNERKRFDKNECKLERFRHITFRKNQCKNENCLRVWQHHHQSIPLYPAVLLLRKCEPS